MTNPPNFHGPRLKVKRAKHHIRHLELAFKELVKVNVKRMRRQNKRQRGGAAAGVPVREDLAAVLGDALHNLHATLDHAYCVLVQNSGGIVNHHTKFPFGSDKQSLVASINGQKPDSLLSANLLDVIVNDVQPYKNGKLELYELHVLDITDKHSNMIPVISATNIERIQHIDAKGLPTGVEIRGITFVSRPDQNVTAIGASTGSLKLYGDPKETFHVLFDQGQPYEGQSILEVLKKLLRNVEVALTMLENACK